MGAADRVARVGCPRRPTRPLEEAESGLERAQAATTLPLQRGRTLLALGSVQRQLRRRAAAHQTLRAALTTFDELGARLWAARAAEELARIGGRPSPAGDGLSETERLIADLVAEGRTNKEVAAALSLSPKTVEWNLTKVYAKLGVHSRTELARLRR